MITDGLPLIDQHCHGVVRTELDDKEFARWLTEADTVPPHRDPFDSLLGLAVRRWCAPLLDLPSHVDREGYLRRRAELGWREVTERLLRAANVAHWLVDTGFTPAEPLTGPGELSAGSQHEVVRVEQVAESVVAQGETGLDAIRSELRRRAAGAVALKTIIAYRCGLALPDVSPSDGEALLAMERWLSNDNPRLVDPVLLAWLVYEAAAVGAELGLPLQVHTGFGDPELRLRDVDPALLSGFLQSTAEYGVTVVLLHCWPYHRNAAYLAHAFGHVIVDMGLTGPFVGARFGHVLAETLELAPFDAVVFSSDGRALPETHHLGAALWRHHTGRLLDEWIAADVITVADAERLAQAIGSGNAARIHSGLA